MPRRTLALALAGLDLVVAAAHLAEDPASPNRIIAATYARGVWACTFK